MLNFTESCKRKLWPAKYFSPQELINASQDGEVNVTSKLLDTLNGCDILRENIGRPIIITNACRKTGSKTSQHYWDNYNALDIWVEGMDSMELMSIVEGLGLFTGRGLYPHNRGFIHVDCRRGLFPKESGQRVSRWQRNKERQYITLNNFYEFI